MDIKTFETEAKAGVTALIGAVQAFFTAHPDLESDAAKALQDAAVAAAPIAEHTVEEVVPPTAADVIDAAIAKVEANAQEAAAKIQADAQTQIQALQAAKATAAAAGA